MGTVPVKRSARRPAPTMPAGEIVVDPPPALARHPAGLQQWLMALPMLGGTVAMAMMMGQGRAGPWSYLIGGLFGISSIAVLATSFSAGGGPRRAEAAAARRGYLRYLAGLRRRIRETARRQRAGLRYRHPDPEQLWSTVASHRLWERRPSDPDFAVIRIGTGPQMLATLLIAPPDRPAAEREPVTTSALRRLLDASAVVPDLPVAVSLRAFTRVLLHGPKAADLVRAVLLQLAVFHAPDELVVAVCAAPDDRDRWEWVKWLPHALHPSRTDALGPLRLVADSDPELGTLLGEVLTGRSRFRADGTGTALPHVVIVRDGMPAEPATDGPDGVTVLDLRTAPPRTPEPGTLLLTVGTDGALTTATAGTVTEDGRADALSVAQAEAVARRLAPRRPVGSADAGGRPATTDTGLIELLGTTDPASRPERDRLRVPIGATVDGTPVELDLKESAEDGMGPHGLIVGATGSGKSELLRTLVLALATTHSPATLNLVLVDFKGGPTFAGMDRLPHTAALITNLEDALPLVDRMADAIEGELTRRQELLRRTGNHAGLRDYERARAAGTELPPLPSLLIVCDEFSELLQRKPEFIELFLQIGRLGRSLGVHLLLASQRLEDGRLRGLDTHLSYRIGLRTFSALESRVVLGVPDAYELPRSPGHGYLKSGTEEPTRFRAAYVSAPLRRTPEPATADSRTVLHWTTRQVPVLALPARPLTEETDETLADVLIARLAGQGPPAHRIWLPPLDRPPTLDDLLGPVAPAPGRGLTTVDASLHGALRVPAALVDKPRDQRRDPLWLRLGGAGGHIAVVGGPRSGKSTAIRTLICGLALTHTPAEAHVYCLDFGGGGLAALRDLPHVGGVFGRLEAEGVRRTIGEMTTLITGREAGGGQPRADVFLVVDGWSTLRNDFDECETAVVDLATRGLAYGLHLVATAARWTDFRPAVRDLFGSRLELRLGDPADSVVGRRAAQSVPEQRPGRGVVEHPVDRDKGLHLLTALPEVTSEAGTDGLVGAVAKAWAGPVAPRVRLLPAVVAYPDIDPDRPDGLRLPLGLAETDLRPVTIDFAADPHFLLFGDAECGKSSFLRTLAATVTRRFPPERARLIVIDYRRSLIDLPETEHRIGYAAQASAAEELMVSVAGYMQRRRPGPDLTARQLRDRSWWTGPELFVLVDDYDLVAAGPVNPLIPLLEHLPHARDVGLHLVLTHRAGGAARALYDPVVQRLRELSTPGLVMSGSPEEGALLGTVRPGTLPPGRGRLVTRRDGTRLIQLACPPPVPESEKSTDAECD
ncbi:type VII secretion protein EccC [Actinoplanes rectilineatus]|uniref:type VII secretion protein EccC n=1 Tax=Actinoplanes rectilineatus TaxID=113571 RepID=UPI0005F29C09|nr:type VII secretion protein EccC [Actinoplanes rectilineatus]